MGSLYSRLIESKAEDNTSSVLTTPTSESTEEDFKYALEERLLCFESPFIYSAKCLKRRKDKNLKNQYFLHYIGWEQKWDEWVGEDSLLKHNDHNLKIQLQLIDEYEKVSTSSSVTAPTAQSTEKNFKYALEERLLCFQKPFIYSAKCLKRRKDRNRKNRYFIRYIGWKCDEWVGEDSLLKLNDHNLKIQLQLSDNYRKASTSSSKKRKSDDSNDTNIKRQKSDNNSPKNRTNVKERVYYNSLTNNKKNQLIPTYDSKPGIEIKIPKQLKQCLDEDGDLITTQHKLIVLPAIITVEHILDNYLKEKLTAKLSPTQKSEVLDVIKVIKECFDEILGTRLLYCSERTQYKQLLAKNQNKRMSEMYGFIHLLRLFLMFDHFLTSNAYDKNTHQLLVIYSNDILRYLSRNGEIFTSTQYSVSSD